VTKFGHYLLGKPFTFHVDHSALVYTVSKASLLGKLARWTLLLQEDEFDIVHRPGAQHTVADYLSRLESGEAPARVADDFPDAWKNNSVVCPFTHDMKYNKLMLGYYFDARRLWSVRASKRNLWHANRTSQVKVTEK
jgi:hypothetical protein